MARHAKPADPKLAVRGRCFRPCALRQMVRSHNPPIKEKRASREALTLVQKRCGGLPPLEMAMSQLKYVLLLLLLKPLVPLH
jgi:hypothetical protein